MKTIRLLVWSVFVAISFSAVAQGHHGEAAAVGEIRNLGETTFENSGNAAAQPSLVRGLLLLHSFEFGAAAAAFRDAQQADPGLALAYWGEAMTYNHPIWGEQDTAAARAVLARLGATPEARLAKATTAREKGYLQAVEALYGAGSKIERDAAYSDAMQKLQAAFPNDLDARAFYALSLLGLTGDERNVENYMKAAAVAEEIYEINPRHPGALHYLIHAYDDPVHAPLGLRAARKYGKIAPAASHAQHMPSHIFFALGMWDDSIEANVASMTTARNGGAGGYHPLFWLEYAYLQEGRRDEAAALVAMVADDLKKKPQSPMARSALSDVCATWIVETGSEKGAPCSEDIDRSGIKAIHSFAGLELARGLAAVRRADVSSASAALARLESLIASGRAGLADSAAASRYDQVSPREIALVEAMAKGLRASILFQQTKRTEALGLAAEAADAERALVFDYGPPPAFKPVGEIYADLLAEAGRADDARAQYERVLERAPGRTLALAGLASAAKRAGHEARASEVRTLLAKQWRGREGLVQP